MSVEASSMATGRLEWRTRAASPPAATPEDHTCSCVGFQFVARGAVDWRAGDGGGKRQKGALGQGEEEWGGGG